MSRFVEYVKMAIQNILANKGRSFLTMLGIIIGISSVIMIMAVGDGTTKQMNADLDDMVGGLVYMYLSEDAQLADEWFTADDVVAIKEEIDGVEGISPSVAITGETVTGKGDFTIQLSGGTEDSLRMYNYEIKYGRHISESDVAAGRAIAVLLDTDAKRLYGSDNVVGMTIDVVSGSISKTYEIVGIVEEPEGNAMVQYTYEGAPVQLYIPYTALSDFGDDLEEFYNIEILTDKTMDSKEITNNIIKLLEARHQSAGEDYFRVQSFADMMGQINQVMDMMTLFISCVAGISLLVGGIGVMNIMLVSVTERTREIGIRKSLGAKTTSIMMQFLAESAILTVLGGIIGIILGLLGAAGICSLISGLMEMDIKPGLDIMTIVFATFFSCAVGVFFGIYPARKAAKLSPIEALRRN
jgi:ABC-type antimicrobial peptide transport system, permease component